MHTCSEQLPIELYLTIFRYFEVHDLCQVFQNLNHHFDKILASNDLTFYVRLTKADSNHRSNVVTFY